MRSLTLATLAILEIMLVAPGLVAPAALADDAPRADGTAYARARMREVGVAVGLGVTEFPNVNVAPSLGWFIADNLRLSTIFGVVRTESATAFSGMIEPSYHVPINPTTWGFVGLGFGYSHVPDVGGGLMTAPRVGASFLVGRGIVTPALSYELTMQDSRVVMEDVSALRLSVGYSTVW